MGSTNATLGNEWEGLKSVLAVRLDNIGDVVLLEPALKAIKQNLKDVRLTLLASPAGSQASILLPELDDVIPRKVIWQDIGGAMPHDIGREYGFVEEIRQRAFDAAIIFTSFSQSPYPPAYVCYLAGVRLRVGMSKEFGGGLLTRWVRSPADSLHQAERNLFLLEELGFQVSGRDLSLWIPPEARSSLNEKLVAANLGKDDEFVLVHPLASCQARTYPLERMAAVVREIMARLGIPVVVCGHDRDRARLAEMGSDAWGGAVLLAGQTNLAEYAALVERASLVVSNNTSSTHLADASRTPYLGIYSGTDLESQWCPRKTVNILLRKPTNCSPCYLFECPFQRECMDFEPEEVVNAAEKLLGGG